MGYVDTALATLARCRGSNPAHAESRAKDAKKREITPRPTGPELADDTPGIVVPPDWRAEVAAWPQPLWVEWRRLVTEYLDEIGRSPEPGEIRTADYCAWCILKPEPEATR